ncbi:PadR family transcriptional regulator [Desulfosporosinus sp. BG]|uniref:PadR family transcriptional regulator n=1 Tax=Desulfosporosinus sp. BG TaxID=1633135 RepID=UPI00083A7F1D|nr:PadR family transcriptional regulator [Desulfosporosinus sp. BG]ODA40254.1 Transcriptional regulator, PadR family [Desulfosporosinus sp. BG]
MQVNKSLLASSTTMLILKLLEEKDMYGYQMIEVLAKRSDNTFNLKAGTLYPILHGLEKQGMVSSYEEAADSARVRKYYNLTPKGRKFSREKQAEWNAYSSAVDKVLEKGDASYAFS